MRADPLTSHPEVSGRSTSQVPELQAIADAAASAFARTGSYTQVFVESTVDVRYVTDAEGTSRGLETRVGIGIMQREVTGRATYKVLPASEWSDHLPTPTWETVARQHRDAIEAFSIRQHPLPPGVLLRHDLVSRAFAVTDTAGVAASHHATGIRLRTDATQGALSSSSRWFGRPGQDLPHTREVERVTQRLHTMTKHSPPIHGQQHTPVVFSGAGAAGLLHELLGHALEADNFATQSTYIHRINPNALPADLAVHDDPSFESGYGSCPTDDDGFPARERALVANGDWEPLQSRLTARTAEHRPGNGRRQDHRSPALPRTSNTIIQRGNTSADELTKPGSQGLLVIPALSSGSIEPHSGRFSFVALDAEWVDASGHSHPLPDVTIWGDAADTLERLEAIGDDFGGDNATCGKRGQFVGIGLFGPSIRFSSLRWSC